MSKFPEVRTHKLSKSPGMGTKEEGKFPAPRIISTQTPHLCRWIPPWHFRKHIFEMPWDHLGYTNAQSQLTSFHVKWTSDMYQIDFDSYQNKFVSKWLLARPLEGHHTYHSNHSVFPEGRVLLEKLGRGVRPASQNPSPINDQNLWFFLPCLFTDQKFDTLFMTSVHSCRKHKIVKGFRFCLYLARVAGVKRVRGRQSADGRRRAWWRSSFF